eukprot:COSAG04_NODE_323_length_16882_cov_5.975627_16_plen_72_part_00
MTEGRQRVRPRFAIRELRLAKKVPADYTVWDGTSLDQVKQNAKNRQANESKDGLKRIKTETKKSGGEAGSG